MKKNPTLEKIRKNMSWKTRIKFEIMWQWQELKYKISQL